MTHSLLCGLNAGLGLDLDVHRPSCSRPHDYSADDRGPSATREPTKSRRSRPTETLTVGPSNVERSAGGGWASVRNRADCAAW